MSEKEQITVKQTDDEGQSAQEQIDEPNKDLIKDQGEQQKSSSQQPDIKQQKDGQKQELQLNNKNDQQNDQEEAGQTNVAIATGSSALVSKGGKEITITTTTIKKEENVGNQPADNWDEANPDNKLNPKLAQGPIVGRKYTDIAFSIIFAILWISMIVYAIVAATNQQEADKPTFYKRSGFYTVAVRMGIDEENRYFSNSFLQVKQDGEVDEQQAQQSGGAQDGESSFGDEIAMTVPLHLSVLIFSMIIAFLYALVLPKCPREIIWSMIYAFLAIIVILALYLIYLSSTGLDDWAAGGLVSLAVILLLLACFYTCLIFCYKERIERAIQLISAASFFVEQNKMILFVPLITFVALVFFIMFWGYSTVVAIDMETSKTERSNIIFLQFFGFLWSVEVCIYFTIFAISQGAALWYFIPNDRKENTINPEKIQMGTVFSNGWKHMGSICFGGLILAIVDFCKYLIEKSQRDAEEEGNILKSCLMSCLQCCCNCIENCVRHLGQMAFVMQSLQGKSARIGFNLVISEMENVLVDYIVLKDSASVFMWVSSLLIALLGTGLGLILLLTIDAYQNISWILPVFIFFIISFAVGAIFMQVYGMSANALLFCVVTENQVNNGSLEHCPDCMNMFKNQYSKVANEKDEEDQVKEQADKTKGVSTKEEAKKAETDVKPSETGQKYEQKQE